MEIGIDFGLFELFAAAGLSWMARRVFQKRWLAAAFIAWSVVAPVVLLFLVEGEQLRWIVVACIVPATVLAATLVMLMLRYDIGELLRKARKSTE